MATISVVKLKVRRGTDEQRRQVVFDNGELAYVTDIGAKRLFIGDGVTVGGITVGSYFWKGSISEINAPSFKYTQVGDIVYNTDNSKLYVLSGYYQDTDGNLFPDYTTPTAYQYIGPRLDGTTLAFNEYGAIYVQNSSITELQLNNSAFDFNNGFVRTTSTSPLRINYDNQTIKINGSKQFYVPYDNTTIKLGPNGFYLSAGALNLNNFNIDAVPRTNPGSGTNQIWIDTANGNVLKVAL